MDSNLTIGSTNGKPTRVRDAAARYVAQGRVPIPLRHLEKIPIPPKWEQITLSGYGLDVLFPVGRRLNVGISLGEPSGGLVDCDLDCDEARRAASVLMPATGMIWGRQSAPDSHRGYTVATAPSKASHPWDDPVRKGKGARLQELRSTGGQTVVPPSILPGDDVGKIEEPCIWKADGEPVSVELDVLLSTLNRVAAAALLGRYWREGTRHACVLAMAGGLLRAGWSIEEAIRFVRAVSAAANDDEVLDRERAVRDTANAIERGEPTTGWPKLTELLGANGNIIVATVRKWLSISNSTPTAAPQRNDPPPSAPREGNEGAITLQATPAVGKPGKFIVVAANGTGELHRDTIDLNSAISRNRLVGATVQAAVNGGILNGSTETVRANLERQLSAFASAPPRATETNPVKPVNPLDEDPRVAELTKMPEDVRAEAEQLLRDPDLLDRVTADIRALGVVGESRNRLILYLTGTSAQLPRPLAVITRGASSSGKSYLADRVSKLFPPEVVLNATSLTTNALYYFPPGYLRHRWVVAGERSRRTDDDAAETTRALREMIEAGRLSKAIPIKEGDRFMTQVIEQPGPIAYTESTTMTDVFAEDANRCLLLNTDETERQTKRILHATAAAATGAVRADVDRIVAVHHALQRTIPRADVIVPFAGAVAERYPTGRHESRRDFRHLLQLVKAVALLRFRQRERDPSGAVVATTDDYTIAEWLAREPLGAAASGVTRGAREFLGQLRGRFGKDEFSTREAKMIGGASPRTLEGHLNELSTVGAVEQTAPPKGRVAARWKLTGADPTSGEGVLPSADEVEESFTGCERAHNP